MDVKKAVKVMNFHSLLRVDKAKKHAEKYFMLEEQLRSMIDHISNNRNFLLDKTTLKIDETKPMLNIYIGSDYGFCSNFNSQIKNYMKSDLDSRKVIIGKKIANKEEDVELFISREEFETNWSSLEALVERAIRELLYSEINVFYNEYVNASNIHWTAKRIYPLEFEDIGKRYNEDFYSESDLNELLVNLTITYVEYELRITATNSFASENVMRQNATSESLKKIEEMEEEQQKREKKIENQENFRQVIGNYTRLKFS